MSLAVHVESAGTARPGQPAWVLLHGWGLNLRVFDALAEALARAARVLRVDLPGHGRSAFDPAAASFEAQARALEAALPEAALVVGWSLGGQFALRLAQLAPSRVRGLVTIASTPRFVAGDDWTAGMKPTFLKAFASGFAADWRAVLDEFLSLQVRGSRDAHDVLQALRDSLLAQGEPDPRALATGLGFLRDNDLRAIAPRIPCPALCVSGQHDRIALPAASAWLAQAMPNARHVELARAGHAPFLSHPGETLALLESFAVERAAGQAA